MNQPKLLCVAALVAGSFCACFVRAQQPPQAPKPILQADSAPIEVPAWLPYKMPPALYQKWRKFGPWDYKQLSSQYYDVTQFNFGATGSAAGLNQDQIMALVNVAQPTKSDIEHIDNPPAREGFQNHAEVLERIRKMAAEDSTFLRIGYDFVTPGESSKQNQTELAPERWNDYRAAFKEAELSEGVLRTDDFPGVLFFLARAKGLCTGGTSAGYAYSEKPLAPITNSPGKDLDKEATKRTKENPHAHFAYVFRNLAPNWYAFYEADW